MCWVRRNCPGVAGFKHPTTATTISVEDDDVYAPRTLQALPDGMNFIVVTESDLLLEWSATPVIPEPPSEHSGNRSVVLMQSGEPRSIMSHFLHVADHHQCTKDLLKLIATALKVEFRGSVRKRHLAKLVLQEVFQGPTKLSDDECESFLNRIDGTYKTANDNDQDEPLALAALQSMQFHDADNAKEFNNILEKLEERKVTCCRTNY